MFQYKRNMQVNIAVRSDDTARAVARLEIGSPSLEEKYAYQIWVEIENQNGIMTIRDAGVDCLTTEAEACDGTRDLIVKMKGVRLDEKYLWRVSNIFGRSNGCQHLYELAVEIARAYSNLKVGEYMRVAGSPSTQPSGPLVDFSRHCAGLSSFSRIEGV